MDFFSIDIICVIFLVITAIIGYKKGFIIQLYDIVSFLFVLLLVYFLSDPLSSIWTIYQYDSHDFIASLIGSTINRIVVGFILFIVFMIIKKIIGVLVKPLLKGIMHTFSLTAFADRLLGLCCHVVEGILIIYICLVFLFIPFVANGKEMIQNSYIANAIVNMIPDVTQTVMNMSDLMQDNNSLDTYSKEFIAEFTLNAMNAHFINEQDALQLFEDYVFHQNQTIQLNPSQIQQLTQLLEDSNYSTQQIQDVLSQVKG